MADQPVPVTFQPLGRTVQVSPDTTLAEAALDTGVPLEMPCGGEGTCGKCRVVVRSGAELPGASELDLFDERQLHEGSRLACQTAVKGPMTVNVPAASVRSSHHQILEETSASDAAATDPIVRKQYVEMPTPKRGDDAADFARLKRVLGDVTVELDLLRQLPQQLRDQKFRGTAVLVGTKLIGFESDDTTRTCHAIAVDVGSTTLVATLFDLVQGKQIAVASRLNPQTSQGDDVLSRIQFTTDNPTGLGQLHQDVTRAIDEMIGQLAEEAHITREEIYAAALSGNTTMQHLLCRIDPQYLGEVPFVPAVHDGLAILAAEIGIHLHPRAEARVLPVIGGFVGGDTVAGILSTEMQNATGPTLLVDIGTNGEIAVCHDGQLLAAATAAGPAFEGARILHGMRAGSGAIERVTFERTLSCHVIGGGRPIGLCGSALIDAAAELLRHGFISPEGRMCEPGATGDNVPDDLAARVVTHGGMPAVTLATEAESGIDGPILLTQRDIRQLQLASGAIRAGIAILLRRVGLEAADLDQAYIAGGFGNFIRRRNARRIGLLPEGISDEKIAFVGNTSLAGAQQTILSERAWQQAQQIAERTEHVDLSTDHGFQWAFADAMIFPEE